MEEISDPPKSSSTGFVVSVLVAPQKTIPISDQHARRIANIISFLLAAIADGNQWSVSTMNEAVASGISTSKFLNRRRLVQIEEDEAKDQE